MYKLAQKGIPLSPGGGFSGPGTGPLSNPSDPDTTFASLLSTVIGLITAVSFIYFTFNLLFGAFNIITAGSDKGKVEGARTKIINSVIGLVVTISAIFLVELLGNIFGLQVLNIVSLIQNISP